jgi:[glutamine synthetase] adenylyltransferase / [glutamine synthetase]-adenylyl-L-tyrosine phosphorylase
VNEPEIRTALAGLLKEADAARLAPQVARLPDPAGAMRYLRRLLADTDVRPDLAQLQAFLVLAGFSPYLGHLLIQNPEFLDILPSVGPVRGPRTREDLEEDLARFQALSTRQEPSIVLRRFKKREYLRIALDDLLGRADLAATTRSLSLLADVLLDKAVRMCGTGLEQRFGRPTSRDDQGHLEEAGFVVIALGKLGGEELNYSSDVDLMFLFSRDGETTGGSGLEGSRSISNKEFFTRLASEITRLIAGGGPEGQVFRVDLGLRPGGIDGELVVSLGAAVAYYRSWAEPWERQALIKARPAAGDLGLGRLFVDRIEPLVYSRDADPDLMAEIAAMKDRIDAQLSAQGRSETDIKLGRGGIREIEFAVQALQLQQGGRDRWLRHGNTLLALHRLAEKGFVDYAEYAALGQAYTFLRDLEHRLQLGQNLQTSCLPSRPQDWQLLARRMRLPEAHTGDEATVLVEALEHHRQVVRRFYDSVFGGAAQRRIEEERTDIWLDRLDDGMLARKLRESGIAHPSQTLRPVKMIRRILQPAARSLDLRRALRRTGPILLKAVGRVPNPGRTLENLERFLSSLASDPAALARCLSRREIVAPMVHMLGRSDLLAGLLIRQPTLLLHLENRRRILKTSEAGEYRTLMLDATRAQGDIRVRAGSVRRRHQEELALIAIRDINRQATLREVLKSLTDLADAAVEAALSLAGHQLKEQTHPVPDDLRLAVLGLGRLGYREMDYGSDLDLVFVHEGGAPKDAAEGARGSARLWCEGMVRVLSTLSRDGQLYQVDLRLRPSGREGELVCSLDALLDYFRRDAEVWEMQSFLKARPVAGDLSLGRRAVEAVEGIILETARSRGRQNLATEVKGMRRRLLAAAPTHAPHASAKLGEGGILDVHFMIEFLQLCHGVRNPSDKDTLRLLTYLNSLGHLTREQMEILYESYLFLRALDHQVRLVHDRPYPYLPGDPVRLADIALALDLDPVAGADPGRRLRQAFAQHTRSVRRVYREIISSEP